MAHLSSMNISRTLSYNRRSSKHSKWVAMVHYSSKRMCWRMEKWRSSLSQQCNIRSLKTLILIRTLLPIRCLRMIQLTISKVALWNLQWWLHPFNRAISQKWTSTFPSLWPQLHLQSFLHRIFKKSRCPNQRLFQTLEWLSSPSNKILWYPWWILPISLLGYHLIWNRFLQKMKSKRNLLRILAKRLRKIRSLRRMSQCH